MAPKFRFTQLEAMRDIKSERINGNLVEFIKENGFYFVRINQGRVTKYPISEHTKSKIIKELRTRL